MTAGEPVSLNCLITGMDVKTQPGRGDGEGKGGAGDAVRSSRSREIRPHGARAHLLDGNSLKPPGREETLEVIKQRRAWQRLPTPKEVGFPFWVSLTPSRRR